MMIGWRARIGQIRPASAIEGNEEWRRVAPEGVAFVDGRTIVEEVTEKGLEAMMARVVDVAKAIAWASPQVIVQCGAPGIFLKGYGYDKEIIAQIETATGVKATTMQTAQVEAMKTLGFKNIALGSIYTDSANKKLVDALEKDGIKTAAAKGLQIIDPRDCIKHEPESAYKLGREVFEMSGRKADGILISCGGFRSFEIIDTLERDTGVPVVTSNQASLWQALRMCGIPERIPGLGKLFREY
jgi:maleate cis-trans isomerase